MITVICFLVVSIIPLVMFIKDDKGRGNKFLWIVECLGVYFASFIATYSLFNAVFLGNKIKMQFIFLFLLMLLLTFLASYLRDMKKEKE